MAQNDSPETIEVYNQYMYMCSVRSLPVVLHFAAHTAHEYDDTKCSVRSVQLALAYYFFTSNFEPGLLDAGVLC